MPLYFPISYNAFNIWDFALEDDTTVKYTYLF